jgi:hypothetical protein
MNLDAGLGGIIDTLKNKFAIEDTLAHGGLMAVKHANGRDWWVIVREYHSDKYYKILITPLGIEGLLEQHIGSTINYDVEVEGCFSPDGSKYCFTSYGGQFDFMQFDRCVGELANAISASAPDSSGLTGCSFSPNSRFLYVSTLNDLYQYDTWNSEMVANVIHVATWDSFVNPIYNIPVLFFMHQLAPDGKIYLSGFNGTEYLNVINLPDSFGLVCDFKPHSYILSQYNFNIPSFPNYDLGALEASPCDTIINIPTALPPIKKSSFSISPNPANEWLNIVYQSSEDVLFELYDVNGQRVAAASLYHYFRNRLIDVRELPAGVYFGSVTEKGKKVWSEKVVVAH